MPTTTSIIFTFLLFFYIHYSVATYQFFKLVEQWPPSTCNGARCSFVPPTLNFTIHGLWGTNKTRPYPVNCGNTPYDPKLIATLRPRMMVSWPSLFTRNDIFWEHEWKTHGTCSEYNFDQFSYFKLTLDSKDRVDIFKVLINAGITRNSSKTYSWQLITRVIKNEIHVDPELRCNKYNNNIQLHEVVLCMDDHGINFIDCPQSTDNPVFLCKNGPGFIYP